MLTVTLGGILAPVTQRREISGKVSMLFAQGHTTNNLWTEIHTPFSLTPKPIPFITYHVMQSPRYGVLLRGGGVGEKEEELGAQPPA